MPLPSRIGSVGSRDVLAEWGTNTLTPYEALPPKSFWREAVASRHPLAIDDLWFPKWSLGPDTRIATAGSCFAQHIGSALRRRGYPWINAEPAPAQMPETIRPAFGYDTFSFRTGNIYTARQLLQWMSWSIQPDTVPTETWANGGRVYDPFRPGIEPTGFSSCDELESSRKTLLRSLTRGVTESDLFIFTLGLTECWRHASLGYEYHSCPGVVAGRFDATVHRFHRQTFQEIQSDLVDALSILREINPQIRVLLTVSPVPLTATASDQHVLVANTHSKSVLRSVSGEICAAYDFVDYFPSYEIINTPPFRGMFFEPNMRTVSPFGVDVVMSHLFLKLFSPEPALSTAIDERPSDPMCDDARLDAFAGR